MSEKERYKEVKKGKMIFNLIENDQKALRVIYL